MDLGTKTALVTGASGWLGVSLVESLIRGLPETETLNRPDRGLRVRCLVAPGQDASSLVALGDRVEVVVGDLRKPEDSGRFCEGAEGAVLFHTAGLIHPKRVADFYAVNVRGTASLLDSAVKVGVRRAVVVSSNSPCGCNPHPDHLFDESSPYNPYMNYGRSKMQMELAVRALRNQGKIEAVIVRPPWFYGPNQPPRQTEFFRMIRDGKAPIVGGGENLRSMAYVDNLCQGLLLAATVPKADGETYWIADARPYSMNEIIATVERVLADDFGQKCTGGRLRLPGAASGVARVADATLQKVGLYHPKIHVLSEMNQSIACSVAKARRELGYKPTVELEEGMRRSLRWLVDRRVAI